MAKRKRRRVPPQAEQPMDIVFVSAEAAPWSKTGGLGDVVGSLPIALADRGHRVMVVVPRSDTTMSLGIPMPAAPCSGSPQASHLEGKAWPAGQLADMPLEEQRSCLPCVNHGYPSW